MSTWFMNAPLENHKNERRVRTLETEVSSISLDQENEDEIELKIEENDEEPETILEGKLIKKCQKHSMHICRYPNFYYFHQKQTF